jgi:ketosteroid isomerase-like protein
VTEQERVLREFYDAFNRGDLEVSAPQFASACEYEFIAFGATATQRSREEVLEGLRNWRRAFPDGRVEATHVIVSGSTVVVEWDSHGTWTGAPIRGEPPNGRRFERRGCV